MAQAQKLCASLTGAWFLGVVTLHPVFRGLAGVVLGVCVQQEVKHESTALRSTCTLGRGGDAAKVTSAVLGCGRRGHIHKPRTPRPPMQSEWPWRHTC